MGDFSGYTSSEVLSPVLGNRIEDSREGVDTVVLAGSVDVDGDRGGFASSLTLSPDSALVFISGRALVSISDADRVRIWMKGAGASGILPSELREAAAEGSWGDAVVSSTASEGMVDRLGCLLAFFQNSSELFRLVDVDTVPSSEADLRRWRDEFAFGVCRLDASDACCDVEPCAASSFPFDGVASSWLKLSGGSFIALFWL